MILTLGWTCNNAYVSYSRLNQSLHISYPGLHPLLNVSYSRLDLCNVRRLPILGDMSTKFGMIWRQVCLLAFFYICSIVFGKNQYNKETNDFVLFHRLQIIVLIVTLATLIFCLSEGVCQEI